MTFIDQLAQGFVTALQVHTIIAMVGGVAWGIIGGAIPGISGAVAMALALPFTFTLDPATALVMLAGVWAGANYGGSIPAILLRMPGTPASAPGTSAAGTPAAGRRPTRRRPASGRSPRRGRD